MSITADMLTSSTVRMLALMDLDASASGLWLHGQTATVAADDMALYVAMDANVTDADWGKCLDVITAVVGFESQHDQFHDLGTVHVWVYRTASHG
jgi:hypothetical protein